MEIKHLFTRSLALCGVAVALTACNLEDQLSFAPTENSGTLDIVCEVSPSVKAVDATRADGDTATDGFTLPAALTDLVTMANAALESGATQATSLNDVLSMQITGKYVHPKEKVEKTYSNRWSSITTYAGENVKLDAGEYEVRIESKPQTEEITVNTKKALKVKEGENNPFYVYESAKGDIKIEAMVFDTKHNAELKLANSCFTLQVEEPLLRYYSDVKLEISTRDGATFVFEPEIPQTSTDSSSSSSSGNNGTATASSDSEEGWDYVWSDGKLYFFNVSEVIKILRGDELAPSTDAALYLKGQGTRQTGKVDYFTADGTATGAAVKINPVKTVDGKQTLQPLANGTHYTITVGHSKAGAGTLTITYEGYDEATPINVNLRPSDMDDPQDETEDEGTDNEEEAESEQEGTTPTA